MSLESFTQAAEARVSRFALSYLLDVCRLALTLLLIVAVGRVALRGVTVRLPSAVTASAP